VACEDVLADIRRRDERDAATWPRLAVPPDAALLDTTLK
jgi:cytidylate kinase